MPMKLWTYRVQIHYYLLYYSQETVQIHYICFIAHSILFWFVAILEILSDRNAPYYLGLGCFGLGRYGIQQLFWFVAILEILSTRNALYYLGLGCFGSGRYGNQQSISVKEMGLCLFLTFHSWHFCGCNGMLVKFWNSHVAMFTQNFIA